VTDKVVISSREVADVGQVSEGPRTLEPKLAPPIPLWVKIAFSVLVIALPLLCVVAVVVRAALRNQPPRTKHAWTAYLCTLLIVSGLLSSIVVVAFLSRTPAPMLGSTALDELDERSSFPALPSANVLDGSEVSQQLKPLVMIVSPMLKTWFGERSIPTVGGAGVLIEANENGYLIATARHVVGDSVRTMIATSAGIWAPAEVIAHHRNLDLALLHISRHSGRANFMQPIAAAKDGEPIYVIGHPQGLRYSLTAGIVSREEGSVVQISAAVSPGNSGGPVYNNRGSLVGIVTSTTDKSANPNAENLNFAVSAEALRDANAWVFNSRTEKYRSQFQFLK
jgi:S1-C subfamily serine protease